MTKFVIETVVALLIIILGNLGALILFNFLMIWGVL
jgi:hypothetical protein